jgi:hypothetical protein
MAGTTTLRDHLARIEYVFHDSSSDAARRETRPPNGLPLKNPTLVFIHTLQPGIPGASALLVEIEGAV